MATVTALQSFVAVLEKDVLGPDRTEKHSEFAQPSVFPGGKGFRAGSLERNVVKQGKSIQVVKGQNFSSNHPVVLKFPELFGEVEAVHPPVEQATAAPGEKRAR